jgi:hypothetical protein
MKKQEIETLVKLISKNCTTKSKYKFWQEYKLRMLNNVSKLKTKKFESCCYDCASKIANKIEKHKDIVSKGYSMWELGDSAFFEIQRLKL